MDSENSKFFGKAKNRIYDLEERYRNLSQEKHDNRYYTYDSIKEFKKYNKPKFPWIYPFYNPFLPMIRKKKPNKEQA